MTNEANTAQAPLKRARICISCGRQSTKTALHRIVRTPQGAVEHDPTGRAPGRGAYVCSAECLDAALASRRIERALKTKVSEQDKERLHRSMREALGDASK